MGYSENFEPVTIGMPIKESSPVLENTFKSLDGMAFIENKLSMITVTDTIRDYSLLTKYNVLELVGDYTLSEKRNMIIQKTNSPYLIMVDSDSIFEITAFHTLRSLIQAESDKTISISLQEVSLFDHNIGSNSVICKKVDYEMDHNQLSCIIINLDKLKKILNDLDINEIWENNDRICQCNQLKNFINQAGYKSGKTGISIVFNTRGAFYGQL